MKNRRIACILIILSAAVLYLFANGTVTLALLVSAIAAPLLSLAVLRLSGRHLEVGLEHEESDPHTVWFRMHNPELMPVSDIEAEIVCTNLRTGENEHVTVSRSIGPKGRTDDSLTVMPGHAGRYEVAAESIRLYDPLRLWYRDIKLSDKVSLTMMPEIFDMWITITSSSASMPESDRYRDDHKGNDPGEVRDIHEYIPGDSIKNIHWKLSGKIDKVLVKELGAPITDQFLVILDNGADVGLNPDALDSIVSVFASVLSNLLKEGLDFTIGWTEPVSGEPVFRKIYTEEDLISAADEYLAVPATTQSAFEVIERGVIDSRFAHLIMAGSQIPAGLETITNGCQVTLLLYGAASEGRMDSGAAIIRIDEHSYRSELADIEV